MLIYCSAMQLVVPEKKTILGRKEKKSSLVAIVLILSADRRFRADVLAAHFLSSLPFHPSSQEKIRGHGQHTVIFACVTDVLHFRPLGQANCSHQPSSLPQPQLGERGRLCTIGSAAASPNSLQSSPRLQGFFRLVPIPPNYAQIYFYFQISTTDSFSFSFKTRSFTLVVLVHHNLYIATSQYLIS